MPDMTPVIALLCLYPLIFWAIPAALITRFLLLYRVTRKERPERGASPAGYARMRGEQPR